MNYNRNTYQGSPLKSSHSIQEQSDQQFFVNNRIFQCQKHLEVITNFSVQELKPLCPECISEIFANDIIDDHSVESLKNVKMHCSKKIKTGIYELNRQLESSEIKYLLNPQGIIDEGTQELQKCKKSVMRIIDFHFEQLFIQFKAQVQENVIKASDLTYIFENIKQTISELELLSYNLDQGHTIQSIVKTCQLDLKSLIDKFKQDIHKIVDSRDLDPLKIISNNNAINEIKRILPQVAVINKIHSHYHDSPQRSYSPNELKSNQHRFLNTHSNTQSPSPNFYENQQIPANPNNQYFQREMPVRQQQQYQQQQPQQQFQHPQQQIQQQNQYDKLHQNPPPFIPPQPKQEAPPPQQITQNNNANRPPHAIINTHQPYLKIMNKDYFNHNSSNKFLVSIEGKILQGVDLNLSSTGKIIGHFEVILPEELPADHSLLVTNNGDIIVTGGINRDTNKVSNEVKRIILTPDRKKCNIETVTKLFEPRYAHSTIQFQNSIYVIGGFSAKREAKNEVEIIYMQGNHFQSNINNECKFKCAYPSLAILQDRYIVKIGGVDENNNLTSNIEIHDTQNGEWNELDPGVEDNQLDTNAFSIFYGSGCVEINNNEILVFGGSDDQNQNSNLSFVLHFNEGDVTIKDIMKFPLTMKFNFINTQAVVSENLVYFKNLTAKNSLFCFNGQQWVELH